MNGNEFGPDQGRRWDQSGPGAAPGQGAGAAGQPSAPNQSNPWAPQGAGGAADAPTQRFPAAPAPGASAAAPFSAPGTGTGSARPTGPNGPDGPTGPQTGSVPTGGFRVPPTAPSGPGGPAGPGGPVPPRGQGAGRPWYKKPAILIPAIVGVVVVLAAAIGIPVAINANNAASGDRLAAEFQTALDEHNAAWSTERLDAVANTAVSPALSDANADFNAQSAATMNDFAARCDSIPAAQAALGELAAAPVPELVAANGADASPAYRAALETSNSLAERRSIVSGFQASVEADLVPITQFCETFPQYNSLFNEFTQDLTVTIPAQYTIANGTVQELPNNLTITCAQASGCVDLYNDASRAAFADAYDATYVQYYQSMADLAGTTCWLDSFSDVCAVMNTEYANAAAAYKKASDVLRQPPNLAADQQLYPGFVPEWQAAEAVVNAADAAIQQAWWTAEPSSSGQTGVGWQVRSLKSYLGAHEQSIASLVESVRA